MTRTATRLLIATAIASLLLSSLSGCFLLPAGPSPRSTQGVDDEGEDQEEAPGTEYAAAGDCWQAEADDMAEWAAWEGDDAVNCADDHQSYTYFAGELRAEVDEPWDHGAISADLAAAVSAQCAVNLRKLGISLEAQRVTPYYFVAPEDDWEDGDHSIR